MTHGADALGSAVALISDHAFVGAPDAQSNKGGFQEFVLDEIFVDGFE